MKKIFVVEDDESICDELVQILENEGYETESLKNFDNTKDDIFKAAPNLVLMDINIPGINGRNLMCLSSWLQAGLPRWMRCCP